MAELHTPVAPCDDPIDQALILDRFDGDRDLLREVIGLFLEDCPRRMCEMRGALARGDCEAAQHTAHSIKGSAGNFAAAAAVEAATRLEMMCEAGDLVHADEAWAALEKELALLTAALDTFL